MNPCPPMWIPADSQPSHSSMPAPRLNSKAGAAVVVGTGLLNGALVGAATGCLAGLEDLNDPGSLLADPPDPAPGLGLLNPAPGAGLLLVSKVNDDGDSKPKGFDGILPMRESTVVSTAKSFASSNCSTSSSSSTTCWNSPRPVTKKIGFIESKAKGTPELVVSQLSVTLVIQAGKEPPENGFINL